MMFRSVANSAAPQVRVEINEKPFDVPEGISVWAAMALVNETITRVAPVTEEEHSAYCAMGVCFECLVEIDGLPNQQACLKKVQKGMRINRQHITQTSQHPDNNKP